MLRIAGRRDPNRSKLFCICEATHQLSTRLERGGEAAAGDLLAQLKQVSGHGDLAANCRALAYRLYNHCEKTKQAEEARSYNGLLIAWPELERMGTDSGTGPAISRPFTGEGSGSSWLDGIALPPPAHPNPQLPTRFVATVKLDSSRASLQMSAFMEEVMSHLQALPGAQIEMTLEVQVNAIGCIDERTARIVLENSAQLKVDKPWLY